MTIHPVLSRPKAEAFHSPPSLTHTDEGLSREGDESDAGSEIYQAFGILPDTGRPESAAGDLYYTRRLYDGDTDYKLYNNEERLYIVSENLGESEKVPVRSNSYMFRGGDPPRKSQSSGNNGWKNSNGSNSNGWKGVPPSRQNSVGPSTNRRDASHKATVLPPLHKVSILYRLSSLLGLIMIAEQAKPGQGSYREPACFPIFRWCLSLLGLAMLLVVVVILGQLLSDFDIDRVPTLEVAAEPNLTLVSLKEPATTTLTPSK